VALGLLLDRFPDLGLADGATWKFGVIVRGPGVLPITW
jgi:hypothetical protein